MKQLLYIFLISFLISSCQDQQVNQPVKKVVMNRLEKTFPKDLFTLSYFSPRGSYKTENIKTKQKELILYYKAKLKLKQNYQFTDWNKPGAQSLTMLLGATASGIQGIKKDGNKPGDEITVYGSIIYRRKGNKWEDYQRFNSFGKNANKQRIVNEIDAVDRVTNQAPRYKQSLAILGKIFKNLDNKNETKILHSTQKELEKVLQKAQMYEDIKNGHIVLSTGPNQGNYQLVATAFDKELQKKYHINIYPSSGSVENINLIRDKRATFAIAQSDIVYMAYTGEGIFKDNMPLKELRAVGSLFPEVIMIITAKKSSIHSIQDLKHKRIAVGARGSGSHADALLLLRTLKMEQKDFANIFETPLATSLEMLKGGDVDAVFVTSSYPLMGLKKLEENFAFRILSLSPKIIHKLSKLKGIKKMVIPAHTYKQQPHPIITVGTNAIIITTNKTENKDVEKLLNALLKTNTNNIFNSYLRPHNMRQNISIPMHFSAKQVLTK